MKLLKQDTDKDGYLRISLQCDNNKRKSFRTNRLVAMEFIPNPKQLPLVNHKNGIKTDNCVDNLEWCTISYNTQHGYSLNDYHFKKKIQVFYENKMIKQFNSLKECANFYNISYYDISKVLNNKKKPATKGKLKGLDFKFVA